MFNLVSTQLRKLIHASSYKLLWTSHRKPRWQSLHSREKHESKLRTHGNWESSDDPLEKTLNTFLFFSFQRNLSSPFRKKWSSHHFFCSILSFIQLHVGGLSETLLVGIPIRFLRTLLFVYAINFSRSIPCKVYAVNTSSTRKISRLSSGGLYFPLVSVQSS